MNRKRVMDAHHRYAADLLYKVDEHLQRQELEKARRVKVEATRVEARKLTEEAVATQRAFLCKQSAMDKACRKHGHHDRRALAVERARDAVNNLRDDAAVARQELGSRRASARAAQRAMTDDERARLSYLRGRRASLEEGRLRAARGRRWAQQPSEDEDTGANSEALASSGRPPEALEVSEGVRGHAAYARGAGGRPPPAPSPASADEEGRPRLRALEPQVRSLLAASGADSDQVEVLTSPESGASPEVELLFRGLALRESLVPAEARTSQRGEDGRGAMHAPIPRPSPRLHVGPTRREMGGRPHSGSGAPAEAWSDVPFEATSVVIVDDLVDQAHSVLGVHTPR